MNLFVQGFVCGGLDFSPLALDFGAVPASRYCYITRRQQQEDLARLRSEGHHVEAAAEHLFSGELHGGELEDEAADVSSDHRSSAADSESAMDGSSAESESDDDTESDARRDDVSTKGQRQLTLCLLNSGLLSQRVLVDSVHPPCFSVAPHLRAFTMAPGSVYRLPVTFRPQNTDTVYMGSLNLKHAFGMCQVPLRGVGSSAMVEVMHPAPVSAPAERKNGLATSLVSSQSVPELAFQQVARLYVDR